MLKSSPAHLLRLWNFPCFFFGPETTAKFFGFTVDEARSVLVSFAEKLRVGKWVTHGTILSPHGEEIIPEDTYAQSRADVFLKIAERT